MKRLSHLLILTATIIFLVACSNQENMEGGIL